MIRHPVAHAALDCLDIAGEIIVQFVQLQLDYNYRITLNSYPIPFIKLIKLLFPSLILIKLKKYKFIPLIKSHDNTAYM
jgi:hypothetical protein